MRRRDGGKPPEHERDKTRPPPKHDRGGAGKIGARLQEQSRKVLGKHYANKYRTSGR